jgi:hypothetical protein
LGFQALPEDSPFEKPYGVPCQHLIQIGCGIYEERPPVCRRFACGWLLAPNLPEALRPDRCGVLFCTNSNLSGAGDAVAVYAYEIVPGAAEKPLPAWLISQLAAENTLILVRADGVEVLTADSETQAQLERNVRPRR